MITMRMGRNEIPDEATHGRAEGVAGDKHGDDAQAVCFWNEQARRRRRLKREKVKRENVGWVVVVVVTR
jgi:hypothetical protein